MTQDQETILRWFIGLAVVLGFALGAYLFVAYFLSIVPFQK